MCDPSPTNISSEMSTSFTPSGTNEIIASTNSIKGNSAEPNLECPICLEDYSEHACSEQGCMSPFCYNTFKTDCNHAFHHECLKKWIYDCLDQERNGTCPYCRKVLAEVEPQPAQRQAVLLELETPQSPQSELRTVLSLIDDLNPSSYLGHLLAGEVDLASRRNLEELLVGVIIRFRANVRAYMERRGREAVGGSFVTMPEELWGLLDESFAMMAESLTTMEQS
jgi:hypothetical protein